MFDQETTRRACSLISEAKRILAEKGVETEGEFWKRMALRAGCGCVSQDCALHGDFCAEDSIRVRFAKIEFVQKENKRLESISSAIRWRINDGIVTRET